MSENQFNQYAAFYNLLYKDKDYRGESVFIDNLIRTHSTKSPETLRLLDLACGTGKHLGELKKLGYKNLTGSDISSRMIEVAKEAFAGEPIEFHNYSFQDSHLLREQYDVVISMFSAVNYLVSSEDQFKAFKNINSLLHPGGLFIFDFWNGNAVVRDYSPVKVLRKSQDSEQLMRVSETNIDVFSQGVTVKFTCLYFKDNVKTAEFEETHNLHYYYYPEMRNLLTASGFEVVKAGPFKAIDNPLDPYEWNISIVARKIAARQ